MMKIITQFTYGHAAHDDYTDDYDDTSYGGFHTYFHRLASDQVTIFSFIYVTITDLYFRPQILSPGMNQLHII